MIKLTEKQKAFCDYYLQTFNATEAARRAGYSQKTARVIGQENLTKPAIKQYIEERLQEMRSSRIATAVEVMEFLTNVIRGEEKTSDKLKAAELLGKTFAMFTDKKEVTMSAKSLEAFFEEEDTEAPEDAGDAGDAGDGA